MKEKLFVAIVFGLCVMVVEFGFVLPKLFSAKSDVFVIAGAFVLIGSLPFWYVWCRSVYKTFNEIKNEKNSDSVGVESDDSDTIRL